MNDFFASELFFSILLNGGIIFILILLSSFFSGSETALTAISKVKIHKLSQKGYKNAKYVYALKEKKDRLIGSILVGNNLVNILASSLATKLCLDIFGTNGVFYATAIMTVMIVLFAEILPKTYALYHSEKTSLFVAPAINLIVKLFKPITFLLDIVIKKCFIITPTSSTLISSLDELRGTIELQYKEKSIIKSDRDMLSSILALSETEVSSIMTHRKNILTINADQSSKDILETIAKAPHTRIPIWKDNKDNIVGVLHAKDVLKTNIYSTKNIDDINFLKIASKPWFIPESMTLKDQLFNFKKERNHFAIVVDEYGSVMGIVTLEDILEEIVGEIKDEYDKGDVINCKKITDNKYLIYGFATIRDINKELDLELPEDDASTVAGLIINHIERIPDREESFDINGLNFYIKEKRKNQITKIILKKKT